MPQDWNGPPAPDDSGNIAVDGFNEFLKEQPKLRRSPVRATIRFVQLKDPGAKTTRIGARWKLESARRTQRCQQGRGHQGFSAKPCR